jgi:hypothetical protein
MNRKALYIVFIDFKMSDRVPRVDFFLLKVLDNNGVRIAYIQTIKSMYDGTSASLRIQRIK